MPARSRGAGPHRKQQAAHWCQNGGAWKGRIALPSRTPTAPAHPLPLRPALSAAPTANPNDLRALGSAGRDMPGYGQWVRGGSTTVT
jgi:hypothetical protein